MAWASAGASNEANVNTSASSWGALTTAACIPGEVLIVCFATDNITTTDVASNDHTSVTSTGDTWTKIGEFTNGNGAANAGATISAWHCLFAGSPGTIITLNLSGSVAAKACSLLRFTIGAGSTAQRNVVSMATLATDAADPASLTAAGFPAGKEYLFVRAIANETNADTAITNSSGWTAFGGGIGGSSTGGGAAANMACGGEYKIATATSSGASDPSWTSGDNSNILFAMEEVVTATPMPIVNFATQIA